MWARRQVDITRLFNREDMFPDVILHYQGQDIYAHKAVLALGSPRFRELFEQQSSPTMREGKAVLLLDDKIHVELQFNDFSRIVEVRSSSSSSSPSSSHSDHLGVGGGGAQYLYKGAIDADLPMTRLLQIAQVAEDFGITGLSCVPPSSLSHPLWSGASSSRAKHAPSPLSLSLLLFLFSSPNMQGHRPSTLLAGGGGE
jgi:hypothetical protein